ncbi:hypothetical protein BJF80_03665 [Serinicoccus sp. CUA-874]|nr:hypothetical protein BJF80_03665 [Serinicoccus sp. CUA-874]
MTDSTLASMSDPIATTARLTEPMPSWRMASPSVASATTVCVRSSAYFCTRRSSVSIAMTSTPCRTSDSQTAVPNRPRPTTSTV